MSNFLKIIKEATPDTDSQVNSKADTPAKKSGFLQKAAAAGAKVTAGIKQIEKIGTGQWNVADALQSILDRQLDSSTNKLGKFGKDGFKKIKLGTDIIEKINKHGATTSDTLDTLGDSEVQTNESFNSMFLQKINEAVAVLDRNDGGGFKNIEQMAGDEKGKSKSQRVWDVLKEVLSLDTKAKLTDPDTGKKVVDRRIIWITKGVPGFLKIVKGIYPDIPFTYEGHDIKTGISGAATEQEEEFNFTDTTKQEWIESLGEEKVKDIVKGLVDIYPGDNIKFEELTSEDEPELTPKDEPEDEPSLEDEPISEITEDIAIFELTKPTGFGQQGTQYTLKPLTPELDNMLKRKDIKYLTYLNQTPQNEFKVPESNKGIIYAYDNNNEVINSITTEPASFQWNGQEKLYTISSKNDQLMGVNYSEGQFPIKDTDAAFIDPSGKYLIYKDRETDNLIKWSIVSQKSADGIYIVNKNKPIPITDKDRNNMLKADGSTPSKDIISNLKIGDVVAVTLASDNDNSARIVTIVSNDDKALTVNDHNKPKSSNYSMTKDNIKDIAYFKK
tara:strand:+ start:2373 stop:4046 length:1674 start_codon:yes stop_codon:yes gene_type:complete